VLSFAIVVTSVLLPRLARLNACLPNQSLGFGEGQPIGIEYHNQEFQGSSQDLDLMDSKSKFRHIRVEALFSRNLSLLVLIVLISLHPFSDIL
jgi:hypothetical protein